MSGSRRNLLAGLEGPEPLSAHHDVERFDCGKPSLDDWLRRWALKNQANETARTYVVHLDGVVLGYFSLCSGSVAREEAPRRVVQGLARHPVPVIVLARLAIDASEQGHGLGPALLKSALRQAAEAADLIGARAVLVHAIDDQARGFYEHFEFERSPIDDRVLMLLMKDLRAALE
ncbi:GNAT family N-acetyltransferase [soil metagenome]